MPSFSVHFMNEPTTAAQRIATPAFEPAMLAVSRSPAPTPVVATRMPGARIVNQDTRGFACVLTSTMQAPQTSQDFSRSRRSLFGLHWGSPAGVADHCTGRRRLQAVVLVSPVMRVPALRKVAA